MTRESDAGDGTDRSELDALRQAILRSLSHEIRTPLTIVRGFTEIIIRYGELDPALHPLLAAQQRAVQRLEKLVDQALLQAEAHDQHPDHRIGTTAVDLSQLFLDVVATLEPRPPPGRIRYREEGPIPGIHTVRSILHPTLSTILSLELKVVPPDHVVCVVARQGSRTTRITVGPAEEEAELSKTAEAADATMGVAFLVAESLIRQLGGMLHARHPGTRAQTIDIFLAQQRSTDPGRP